MDESLRRMDTSVPQRGDQDDRTILRHDPSHGDPRGAPAFAVPATPLVRTDRLGPASRDVSGHRRPAGPVAAEAGQMGTMRLVTIGRRSGREREAIVAYFEDGPNLVTMAMNGWAEGEPAWWLNLQAQPDVMVELKGMASRAVRGRVAEGEEREQLWQTWRSYTDGLDGYATRRTETAVIVLEPRPVEGAGQDRSPAEAQ